MAGATSKPANPGRVGKRVEAETASLKRARDGSAFTRCEACNKDVPVALIDMHCCSLDSKIRMNLEAQVVEKATELKKPSERKRTASSEPREKRGKKEKKSKDPNAPKRPPTAFFLFMDDFRKEFERNPESKKVSASAKEGGEKWKSMNDEEKKQYFDKAAELKAEYVKATEKHEVDDIDDETTEQADEADDNDDETTEQANEADENKTSVQVHEDEGSQKEED